jgi:hypothetical protein
MRKSRANAKAVLETSSGCAAGFGGGVEVGDDGGVLMLEQSHHNAGKTSKIGDLTVPETPVTLALIDIFKVLDEY